MKVFLITLFFFNLVFGQPTNSFIKNFGKLVLEISKDCENCQKNYEAMHQAFQDPSIRQWFLSQARQICETEECLKFVEVYVESITRETDPKKGCAFVCGTQEEKEFEPIQNLINKIKLFEKISFHSFLTKNENLQDETSCENCLGNYEAMHQAFQDPSIRQWFLSQAKQRCETEECLKFVEDFVESVTRETDPKKGCAIACGTQEKKEFEPIQNLINKIKLSEKISFHSFLTKNENLQDETSCENCLGNYEAMHQAFQDPSIRQWFLSQAKQRCETEECLKFVEDFVESVTRETDPKKGCALVCGN